MEPNRKKTTENQT